MDSMAFLFDTIFFSLFFILSCRSFPNQCVGHFQINAICKQVRWPSWASLWQIKKCQDCQRGSFGMWRISLAAWLGVINVHFEVLSSHWFKQKSINFMVNVVFDCWCCDMLLYFWRHFPLNQWAFCYYR